MDYIIYKITNPQGEVYIGRTKDLDQRMDLYSRYSTLPKQPKLFESFDLYGFKNHQIEVIEITDNLNIEAKYIEEYNSYNNGFNSNKGGGGPVTHNEETKKKISKAGRKNVGKRSTSHWKGKKRGDEFGKRMSEERKGKPNPKNRKPVLQYSKQGELIKKHPSIEEAAKCVGGNPTSISNCLRGNILTSAGFVWVFE